MNRTICVIGALVAAVGTVSAQSSRKATMVNGGGPNQGKCTVEVLVDGGAQVEIRGDTATLRDMNGQPPQWRRFECTAALPANPTNFRFAGVDGRGSQSLIRDPRNGGTAVVQIEDRQGGAEAYTFDLFWGNGPASFPDDRSRNDPRNDPRNVQPPVVQDRAGYDQRGVGQPPFVEDRSRYDQRGPGEPYGDRGGFPNRARFTAEQAVKVCQDSVRTQAYDRFRVRTVQIGRTNVDNNPGRNDWVLGELAVPRRFGRSDTYRFSCSVNLDNGQVRTAHIDQFPVNAYSR